MESKPAALRIPVRSGTLRCPVLSCARLRINCFGCGKFLSWTDEHVICAASVKPDRGFPE
jgi:hypothetical protein